MGSNLVVRTFRDCSESSIREKIEIVKEQASRENGTSYSGDWGDKSGIVVHSVKEFDSIDEAERYIDEVSQKDDPIVAVRAKEMLSSTLIKAIKLENKSKAFLESIGTNYSGLMNDGCLEKDDTLYSAHLMRLKSGKSKTKACPKCGQRIVITKMETPFCPHCGERHIFFNKVELNKLKRLEENSKKLYLEASKLFNQHHDELKAGKKVRKSTGYYWVAGGNCKS